MHSMPTGLFEVFFGSTASSDRYSCKQGYHVESYKCVTDKPSISESQTSIFSGPVVGGVLGGTAVLITVIVFIFAWRRYTKTYRSDIERRQTDHVLNVVSSTDEHGVRPDSTVTHYEDMEQRPEAENQPSTADSPEAENQRSTADSQLGTTHYEDMEQRPEAENQHSTTDSPEAENQRSTADLQPGTTHYEDMEQRPEAENQHSTADSPEAENQRSTADSQPPGTTHYEDMEQRPEAENQPSTADSPEVENQRSTADSQPGTSNRLFIINGQELGTSENQYSALNLAPEITEHPYSELTDGQNSAHATDVDTS